MPPCAFCLIAMPFGLCCSPFSWQGPGTWLTQEYCNGKRQSPINIRSEKAIHNRSLGAITLTGYDDGKKLQEMINSGKTVDIELEDGLYFTGHGLPAQYAAKSFHFHWGDGDSRPGSEHYIDNRQYPMELHIVHTKNNTSVSDARKDPEGIAVLGFFLEVRDEAKRTTFSLLDLLGPTDFARYFRYPGSLTTPQCNEVVIWTIFPDPILDFAKEGLRPFQWCTVTTLGPSWFSWHRSQCSIQQHLLCHFTQADVLLISPLIGGSFPV
uniref:Carbonic anhydrase n=1 Tax=Varanus komodoensis TaxID=61221 RepID=A0A8D2IPI2_VARKO